MKQVNKETARKLFEQGQTISLYPCNVNPKTTDQNATDIQKNELFDGQKWSFDKIVNYFEDGLKNDGLELAEQILLSIEEGTKAAYYIQ